MTVGSAEAFSTTVALLLFRDPDIDQGAWGAQGAVQQTRGNVSREGPIRTLRPTPLRVGPSQK
jgi:hypothetical protein